MACNVNQLTGNEMIGRNFCTNIHKCVVSHAEFDEARLRLNLGLRKVATLWLGNILGFGRSGAKLNSDVTVTIQRTLRNDLAIFQRKNGNGNVTTIFLEDARHADLLRDHASAHDPFLLNTEAHGDPFPAGMFNPKIEVTPSGLVFRAFRQRKDGGRSHISMDVRYPKSLRDQGP
jgi:hypothetical protein